MTPSRRDVLQWSLVAALLAPLASAQAPTRATPAAVAAAAYDPLRVAADSEVQSLLLTAHDGQRDRDIPLRVYLPETKEPAPIVLFSHGLGGSRDTSPYLGEHWAKRGYIAVFVQHPGSDEGVWRSAPRRERMDAMRAAANGQQLLARAADVHAVLDQLETWHGERDHALHGRLDLAHVGMSGHSFGAYTTQITSGQGAPLVGQAQLDPRIDAALPMSPNCPKAGNPASLFGKVALPWLCMTGTADVSPIGDQDMASRRKVFAALPATIDHYELVLDGAEHSAFVGGEGRAALGAKNPNHHRAILALSTAFWDAYLRGDAAARAWLQGDGARGVLEAKDGWESRPAQAASAK